MFLSLIHVYLREWHLRFVISDDFATTATRDGKRLPLRRLLYVAVVVVVPSANLYANIFK